MAVSDANAYILHNGVDVAVLPATVGSIVVAQANHGIAPLAELAMHRLVSATLRSGEPADIMHSALRIALETSGWRWAAITEFLGSTDEVEVLSFLDRDITLPDGGRYDVIGTPCHSVVRSEDAVFLDRMSERFCEEPALISLGAESYVGMVYRVRGRAVGHVFLMSDEVVSDRQRREAEALIRVFSAFIGPRLELLRAYKDLDAARDDANRDALTGLGNRRGFDAAMARVGRLNQSGALNDATLAVFDVDGLKRINDSEGHARGDQLIARTAALLNEMSRSDDLLFRLGGDEFALLVSSDAKRFLEGWSAHLSKLDKALAAEFPGAGISAGVARLSESTGDAKEWLTLADSRMYAAKQSAQRAR
jgi:diguanylate cyclase (GGDEF)-like protein